MACSEARMEANRRNAQLSTGPRTEEGKAISRGNALKDGFTGKGIVLPPPMKADFEFEYARWAKDFQPTTVEEESLLKTLVLAAARIVPLHDEQNRLEEANREHELECGEIERVAAVQHWYRRLSNNPALALAEIQRTSTGCRWLAGRWEAFEHGLDDGGCLWTDDDLKRVLDLLGIPQEERHISRKSRDIESLYKRSKAGDATAIADLLARVKSQRERLIHEGDRLESGHETYVRESLMAGRRVDMSPGMMRLRRLEAANTQTFYRCLHLFEKLRAGCAVNPAAIAAAVPKPAVKQPEPPNPPPPPPAPKPATLSTSSQGLDPLLMEDPDEYLAILTDRLRKRREDRANEARNVVNGVYMNITAAAPHTRR